MNNLMAKIFKSSMLSSIALAILGALLIFQSEITIISISYVIGGVLVAIGVLAILKYLANLNKNTKNELDIVYGIVSAILGIVVINNPKAIASIIPIVAAFIIIITSANKLQYGLELKVNGNNLWKSTIIISIITIICGILLIFNPFQGAVFITKVVGTLILIYAILDIISTLTIKNTVKQLHEALEETMTDIQDAEIIEEQDEKETTKKSKNKKSNKKNKKED
jgi:uncharacterized membrane protein HdeD (DUF308 family)